MCKRKPKSNEARMHVCKRNTYTFDGIEYQVNAKGSGIYTRILKAMLETLCVAELQWERVSLIRLDLHMGGVFTDGNPAISKFNKNLMRKLKRKYNFQAKFAWVREVASNLHYHYLLYLDAKHVKYWTAIWEIARQTWVSLNVGFNVSKIKNPLHKLDSDEARHAAIFRISYMAKAGTKGIRDLRANDFGTSQGRAAS